MKTPTAKKLSNNQKAVLRVIQAIEDGRVVTAYDALNRGTVTVGPYREAVDRGMRFAVVRWTGIHRDQSQWSNPQDAAWSFLNRVGSTRAREAAIKAMAAQK